MNRKNAPQIEIRPAEEADCGLILEFIKALAVYEKRADQVTATEEGIRQTLFSDKYAETIIGEADGNPVGFALFFHNYSTFLGQPGIYLEDLFVREEYRGRGYGRELFLYLAKVAVERGCGRFDWSCLDWNANSIAFYRKMGAVSLNEWVGFRLEGEKLLELAQSNG